MVSGNEVKKLWKFLVLLTEKYIKRSAEINAAFDILEKAYEIGMMGPDVKDFREEDSSERSNDNTTNNNNW